MQDPRIVIGALKPWYYSLWIFICMSCFAQTFKCVICFYKVVFIFSFKIPLISYILFSILESALWLYKESMKQRYFIKEGAVISIDSIAHYARHSLLQHLGQGSVPFY
ncbi:hypothetical protein ACQJBY_015639 [Aegilops geniculata]